MIDEQGLYDIYQLSSIPFWKSFWFVGITTTLIMSISILGCYFLMCMYWKRPKKQIPYWKQAYKELEQLRMQIGLKPNKKAFYTTLTRILKYYLSHYYNDTYHSKTDFELFEFLSTHTVLFPPDIQITPLFHVVTPVKFARSYDKKLEMEKDIERVLYFIQKTAPHKSEGDREKENGHVDL